jgi:hypothetical protein
MTESRLLTAFLIGACGADPGDEGRGPRVVAEVDLIGGCIQPQPVGAVPTDLLQVTDVIATDEYPPFTKKAVAAGLTLAAGDDASDDFMRLVVRAIEEIFSGRVGIDAGLREEVVRNHYRYRALIPVPVGDDFSFAEAPGWESTEQANTVCDIIMEAVPRGQVMEVVEHILHYVTDVGLHYTFPEEWGISETSVVNTAMETAITEGWYGIDGYEDIGEPEVRRRILIQEFAYWVISTAWDLQRDYGPDEEEWTIRTPEELAEKLPELWAAYENTVARTMVAPSLETLRSIGPTRAEERSAAGR